MSKTRTLQFFQKLSRAFLVPIAVIAASSLFMGVSSIFTQPQLRELLPFLNAAWLQYVAGLGNMVGTIVMANLPVIFAVCISFSLSDEQKEYAAFAGFLGYISFLTSMGILLNNAPNLAERFPGMAIISVLGINTLNVGILGGILTGVLVSILHRKLRHIKLPMAFAFFQGVRFVPFACSLFFMIFGQLFPFLWVYFSQGVQAVALFVAGAGAFGPFIYGAGELLLVPTGLHQIWNTVIRDTAVSGVYFFPSGLVLEGGRPAFFQYLAEGLPYLEDGSQAELTELVKFLRAGQIPMTVFAMPAVAYAIYKSAKFENRALIKPLVITGAVTAFVAGISEPLIFLFLFASPLLFVVFALMHGASWMVLYMLGNQVGGTSATIIGLVIFGILRPESRWIFTVMVGLAMAVINYFLFRWWIVKFDVKTPGRGGDYDDSLAFAAEIANVNVNKSGDSGNDKGTEVNATDPMVLKAQVIIPGLGGKDNIVEVESCMSRLRVVVKDMSLVNEEILRKTGCQGIVKPDDKNVQIIYGTSVGMIKNAVDKELKK